MGSSNGEIQKTFLALVNFWRENWKVMIKINQEYQKTNPTDWSRRIIEKVDAMPNQSEE